jgi:hypothetical protein
MPINWADQEIKDRLLAAIIASFDGAVRLSLSLLHIILALPRTPSNITYIFVHIPRHTS